MQPAPVIPAVEVVMFGIYNAQLGAAGTGSFGIPPVGGSSGPEAQIIQVDTSGPPDPVELPSAADAGDGAVVIVEDYQDTNPGSAGTFNITIETAEGELIQLPDNTTATTFVLDVDGGRAAFKSNGALWLLVGIDGDADEADLPAEDGRVELLTQATPWIHMAPVPTPGPHGLPEPNDDALPEIVYSPGAWVVVT